MRASINFEVEMDRVLTIMNALVLEETQGLQAAIDRLCETTPEDLYDGVNAALENIHTVTRQLEQYRAMIASFQKAKFETTLPQPADVPLEVSNMEEAISAGEAMQQFDAFLGRIGEDPDGTEEG